MYTQIGLPKIGLNQLFALVKEAYEIYPHGFIKIVLDSGESFMDPVHGGYVSYEYSKDLPVRDMSEQSPLKRYQSPSNPNLYAAYKDVKFQELCRKHGIEPVVDIPM